MIPIYPNLVGEIAKHRVKKKDIANAIGVYEKTLREKIYGLYDFSLSEAFKIRDTFFPNLSLEELFKKEDDEE